MVSTGKAEAGMPSAFADWCWFTEVLLNACGEMLNALGAAGDLFCSLGSAWPKGQMRAELWT